MNADIKLSFFSDQPNLKLSKFVLSYLKWLICRYGRMIPVTDSQPLPNHERVIIDWFTGIDLCGLTC